MPSRLLVALPLLLAATGAAMAAPTGFKPALSHKGECEAMVPSAWVPGFAGIGMKAPSGSSQVMISLKPSTLAEVKGAMGGVFKISKTYESSATRYWIEYVEGAAPVRHWYVLTQTGSTLCSAILDFDSGLSETDAKIIATSLKKH
ncbi:MAG TPA: hypothetical protein VHZ29_02410 [Rhizomicrobium sp.]|jgi:hypothetical protein|nr:hypothetical protein [Rhizomicrobium sp.]